VRLLLDTSALIRWHAGTMKPGAVRAVREADLVAVSAVSAWEIAIKRALGKLKFAETVEDVAAAYGFTELPVTLRHGDRLRELPHHHSDSFDRVLIVQALEEGLTILTSDRAFERYRVPILSC
jgi:PIN domain nuclease of toxin-antitoxin system